MEDLVGDLSQLTLTFWILPFFLAALSVVLWLTAAALKRAHDRRKYHAWQQSAPPERGRAVRG